VLLVLLAYAGGAFSESQGFLEIRKKASLGGLEANAVSTFNWWHFPFPLAIGLGVPAGVL